GGHPALTLVLLWLVGVNLRTVILGVPPTLPALHQALGLSYSAAGLLTSLPVFLMAAGAIPDAYRFSLVGARRARAVGLALVGLAGGRGGVGGAGCDRARPLADRHSDVRGHRAHGRRLATRLGKRADAPGWLADGRREPGLFRHE